VIGLDYADVHEEACRWEHVMSEAVERKLLTLLGNPTVSPFGNPIPGLDALQGDEPPARARGAATVPDSLAAVAQGAGEGRTVVIRRISEQLQEDGELLRTLADQGVRPGATMLARMVEGGVTLDGALLPAGVAQHLFVAAVEPERTRVESAAGR
jgi:DtxR family Mn-dependent transcriptional regulator